MTNATQTTMSTRTYGVEIEAYGVDRAALARALCSAGINASARDSYTHATTPHWKIVTDVSISGAQSFEVVSPILRGEAGLNDLATVCRVLAEMGAKVNRTTGLHVHVDGADFIRDVKKIKNIARMFMKYETCFDSLVPASRRANNNRMIQSNIGRHADLDAAFTAIKNATTMNEVIAAANGSAGDYGRYHKLNLCSLLRHGTVEFRQHGGSIDAAKISNWVRLVTDFADEAAASTLVSKGGAGDFKRLTANAKDAKVRQYLTARRAELVGASE